jgi:hypothetical protein
MAEWDQGDPLITQKLRYCPLLMSALSAGTFVLVSGVQDVVDVKVVCCIVDCWGANGTSEPSLKVNVFREVGDNFPLENVRKVIDPTLHFVPEVVQTLEFRSISPNQIIDIAFVFKTSFLLDSPQYHVVQGISNVFQLRYRSDSSLIGVGKCLPFPSCYESFSFYPDCYSSRIWNGLELIRDEMNRLLGRYAMSQGDYSKGNGKVTISKEVWEYIVRRLHVIIDGDCSQKLNTQTTKRIKRVLHPGFKLCSHRVVSNEGSFLRFQTNRQLCALVELFGETVLCNIRKRRPRVDTSVKILENDKLNVVVGSRYQEDPFKVRTVKDGIDLRFDGVNELRIDIRYRQYVYEPSISRCPSQYLRRVIQRLDPRGCNSDNAIVISTSVSEYVSEPTIALGSEFEDGGRLYCVIGIDHAESRVTAECRYPPGGGNVTVPLVLVVESIRNRLE